MNGDLTVGDVMTREFVGVSEGDAIDGVADLMVEAGVEGAVVLRGSEPAGMLDARDVLALVAAGSDPGEVTAGVAMSEVVTVPPDAAVREAVSRFSAADVRRLAVVEDGRVAGTVSEHDVLTARWARPEVATEPPIAAGEAAAPDDRYSTQSVCEACGSLAETLSAVNGQLLCADCRDI